MSDLLRQAQFNSVCSSTSPSDIRRRVCGALLSPEASIFRIQVALCLAHMNVYSDM